jgi:hypothetical protein
VVEGGSARINNAKRLANEKRLTEKSVDSPTTTGKRASNRRAETPEQEEVVIKKLKSGAYFAFDSDSA